MSACLEPVVATRKAEPDPKNADTIALIMEAYRRRRFHMEMRIKLWNALGAQLRRGAGHSTHLEGEEADAAREVAKKIAQDAMAILDKTTDAYCKNLKEDNEWFVLEINKIAKQKKMSAEALQLALSWREDALRTKQALKAMEPTEKAYEKSLLEYASKLPKHVVDWVESEQCRGFGMASLAAIVAEAGDLANYDNPAKLWKRLGVAVINGSAQGHPAGFYKDAEGVEHGRKPAAEEWIEHGYCKTRRSMLWIVGSSLIRAVGWYKTNIYDRHKAIDREKHPMPSKDQIKKDLAAGRRPMYTDIHMHRRAQRYMEKRFIRDLWNVWCFRGINEGWIS